MKVKLKFFAGLRDYFKMDEQVIELDSPLSAKEIFLKFFPEQILARELLESTRFAINFEYVDSDTILKDGDELAFIPPVSGG